MDMDTTDSPDIRFCRVCSENVYLCETDGELIEAIAANKCVAMYDESDAKYPTLLGDVAPPSYLINNPKKSE